MQDDELKKLKQPNKLNELTKEETNG